MEGKRPGRRTRIRGISDLGDGRYRIRVKKQNPRTGAPQEKERIIRAASISEAARIRLDLEATIAAEERNVAVQREHLRLGPAAKAWLSRKLDAKRPSGETRLAPNTRDRYSNSVNQAIVPYLGERVLASITRADVQRWRDHLGAHYKAATVNGHLRVLRDILRDAGHEEPTRVRGLAEDDTRITAEEPNMLEGNEVERFVKAPRRVCPSHLAFVLVLLTTAQRISTTLALRREDFDPDRGVVVARRRRSGKEVISGVKRSRSAQDVAPLLPEVWDQVRAHWRTHNVAQVESGLAFPAADGGYRSRSFLDDWFKRILTEAGISKRFTPHGCRRTAANEYRRAVGESLSKRIAGHLTSEMHEHYTRLADEETAAAGARAFGRRLHLVESADATLKGGKSGDRGGDQESAEGEVRLSG